MKLTLANLSEVVDKELGREPGRSTMESLINEAGEAWVNAHDWFYLKERSGELTLVAETEDYKLPAGLRSLMNTLYRPDSLYLPIPVIDFESFTVERERYLSSTYRTTNPVAVVRWDTKTGDDRPGLYLSVYPASLAERVVYRYHAGWLPLDEQADVADIPAPLVQPFTEWVRRYAMAREFDDSSMDRVVLEFFAGPTGAMAKLADARHRGTPIPAPGGAGDRYNRIRARRRMGAMGFGSFTHCDYLRLR